MNKVATIGTFDGVHSGHRFLLEQVIRQARADGSRSLVVTFANSPRSVIDPSFVQSCLTTYAEKHRLLLDMGVDEVLMMQFTAEMMQMSARQFMQQLHDEQGVTALVIGYDHRFGHNRTEGFDDYCRYGSELGIKVIQAEAYRQDSQAVSSSLIRKMIAEGDIMSANQMLSYHYTIDGTVVNGFHIGRTIGYPTANIQLPADKLVPADGVYAVIAALDGQEFVGMLNIGCRPTFDNGQRSIEVHLLDFDRDIYSHHITLRFIQRIRDERRFDSVEKLLMQIHQDERVIRTITTNLLAQ